MKWELDSAKKLISSRGGMIKENQISIANPGIKTLGAIDYLVTYHKFTYLKGVTKDDKKRSN